MPTTKRALTAKQASFIEYYCNPASAVYNNAMQSAIKAGYAKTTANLACKHILGNIRIKTEIAAYRAKNHKELVHDRTVAIELLTANLARAREKAETGDIQAVGAITAIIRELNAISALHSQTVNTQNKTLAINVQCREDK